MLKKKAARPLSNKELSVRIRRIYLSLRCNKYFYRTSKFGKRTCHLFYRFKNEDWLRNKEWEFKRLDDTPIDKGCTVDLFQTLPRKLHRIYREVELQAQTRESLLPPDMRHFRGKFVQLVREHRKLSQKQLCKLLNSHPAIANLDERYPCFHHQYPFSVKFLNQFEQDTRKILEYCRQGFLFGIGFPTDEFTVLVARICNAEGELKNLENLIQYARYGC